MIEFSDLSKSLSSFCGITSWESTFVSSILVDVVGLFELLMSSLSQIYLSAFLSAMQLGVIRVLVGSFMQENLRTFKRESQASLAFPSDRMTKASVNLLKSAELLSGATFLVNLLKADSIYSVEDPLYTPNRLQQSTADAAADANLQRKGCCVPSLMNFNIIIDINITLLISMKISINSKFQNISPNNFGPVSLTKNNGPHPGHDLLTMIQQYQNQQQSQEDADDSKKDGSQLQINNISQVCLEAYVKNNVKPVRMFKDRMELEKENVEKKIIVKQLENVNRQLKLEYDSSLNNNRKMELFLKEIQFIFKNDRTNQKANQTLLKATKTLHRQKQQSKNYIQKLVKKANANEMRELKTYLKVLQNEKKRLAQLLTKQIAENEKLRKQQDFNHEQLQNFQYYQNLTTQILSTGLKDALRIRQNYKKQKTIIKTSLNCKEVDYVKRQTAKIDKIIVSELLRKQGLQYEIEILKTKAKEKNKRNTKEQGSVLKQQINKKYKKISILQQQLKQKVKTHQYIIRWTKQLKAQLQELKQNHINVKEQFEEQINKLSRQIEEWNRKYKAELIEEQNVNKKGVSRENQVRVQNTSIDRKIRVVKVYEVEHLRKKIIFFLIENNINTQQFVRQKILGVAKSITLKQLYKRLCDLDIFEDQDQGEIYKLARYIVEDNNCNYTKINPEESIQNPIAKLIFKNLLSSDINSSNLNEVREEIKVFLDKNFDQVRHSIWIESGKSSTFSLTNLRNAFAKYIKIQLTISKFVQYIEYLIWKNYNEEQSLKITSFQKVSELILGKKLVKDNQNRISNTTIRSVFDRLYLQKIEALVQ